MKTSHVGKEATKQGILICNMNSQKAQREEGGLVWHVSMEYYGDARGGRWMSIMLYVICTCYIVICTAYVHCVLCNVICDVPGIYDMYI